MAADGLAGVDGDDEEGVAVKDKVKTYIADIADFKPDPNNANRHTQRGQSVVRRGMEQRGYARPAFAAKDGTVLGGNLSTMEVAADIGLGDGKVLVVETDGTIPIIHKRTDVEPGSEAAKLLAIEDNRSAELSLDWDPLQLAADLEAGLDLGELFRPEELSAILEAAGLELAPPEIEFKEYTEKIENDIKYVTCPHCGKEFPK